MLVEQESRLLVEERGKRGWANRVLVGQEGQTGCY